MGSWRSALRIMCIALIGITIGALAMTILPSVTARAHSDSVKMTAAPPVRCPGPMYQYDGRPLGIPAIVPRNDCTPSFTPQDALNYVRTHPFPNKGIAPVRPLTVTKVAFIPVQEMPASLHFDMPGLPGSAIVCYVDLYGSVTFTSLAAEHSPRTATVYEVFDGRSGNLLASGG